MDSQSMKGRSLEEIDGSRWGDPPADATPLAATVHRLRRVPIDRLDVEGLRMLIGQKEGLDALVPLALDRLEADPLAEGDYYPGDLLAAVLAIPSAHWLAHARQRDRLSAVLDTVTDLGGDLRKEAGFDIDAAVATFRTTLAHKPLAHKPEHAG